MKTIAILTLALMILAVGELFATVESLQESEAGVSTLKPCAVFGLYPLLRKLNYDGKYLIVK